MIVNLRTKHKFPHLIHQLFDKNSSCDECKRYNAAYRKSVSLVSLNGFYYFMGGFYICQVSEEKLKAFLDTEKRAWKYLKKEKPVTLKLNEIEDSPNTDYGCLTVTLEDNGDLHIGCNYFLSRHQLYRIRKRLGLVRTQQR